MAGPSWAVISASPMRCRACVELGRELRLGLVDELAHGGALLLGHGAHLLHQRGEFAVGADIAGLGGLEVGARLEGRELGRGLGEEGGEGGLHGKNREKGRAEGAGEPVSEPH
jgi:hypothetical protein